MRIRSLPHLVAGAALLGGSGCALASRGASTGAKAAAQPAQAVEPPAPTPRYSTGRAMQDFQAPSGAVAAAVLEAMDDLKMTVTRRGQEGAASQVEGRTADGRNVTVTLRVQKPITRVSCRIGWFGDEPLSRTLLRRVGVRLGILPPEPIPDNPPSAPASNPYFSRDAIPDSEMMRDYYEAPYRSRPDL